MCEVDDAAPMPSTPRLKVHEDHLPTFTASAPKRKRELEVADSESDGEAFNVDEDLEWIGDDAVVSEPGQLDDPSEGDDPNTQAETLTN